MDLPPFNSGDNVSGFEWTSPPISMVQRVVYASTAGQAVAPRDTPAALLVLRFLHTFFIPLLIVLGLIGNGLSFTTFLFTRLRVRASSFYLGTLALSDFGYLFIMAFVWVDKHGVRILNRRGMCQVILFLSSAFSFWSVWLTVTFTAERCLAVQCPLWRMQLSTRRRARATIVGTAVASFVLNAYLLVLTDVVVQGGKSECTPLPQFERVLYYANIVDTVITLVIPFLLIVVMNVMIGRALYLFNNRRRLQRVNSSQLNSTGTGTEKEDPDVPCACTRTTATHDSRHPNCRHSSSSARNPTPPPPSAVLLHPSQISVSRMLFLVCTVFIILNLPSYALRLHVFVLSVSDQPVPEHIVLLQRYFMLLYYTNFAVNFLLYNMSSRIFRRILKQYLRNKWQVVGGLCRSSGSSESTDSPKNSNFVRNQAL